MNGDKILRGKIRKKREKEQQREEGRATGTVPDRGWGGEWRESVEKVKRSTVHVVICVGLLCLIWGGYFLTKYYGTDRILEVEADDFSWVYQVDSVEIDNGDFVLRGFAFELDRDATEGAYEIVLQDIESGKRYFPKMEYMERMDVNEYFLCEYDYLQTGFEAMIKAKKLDLDTKDYEVLLRRADERQTYQTGTYISKGELMYANPQEFEPLNVEGTGLEKIVEEGILRVYRPDYGMYVYQYEGELYWIAEDDYKYDKDGDTYIQCQLDTTQVDKLPEHRLKNQWNWDNIGFLFTSNELVELSSSDYRVASEALPTEYAIEKIWTGNYVDFWIWRQNFRPYYQLEARMGK